MQRERRLIWVEDRYQLLGRSGLDRYYGRAKGEFYVVYRKCGDSVRRETWQTIDGEGDWAWDSDTNRLIKSESTKELDGDVLSSGRENLLQEVGEGSSEHSPPHEHVLRGYLDSNRLENLTVPKDGLRGSSIETEVQLESGARAILLAPSRLHNSAVVEWVVSLHGGPESLEGTEIRYGGLYRELLRQGLGIAILNYRGSIGIAKPNAISWRTSIQADFDSLLAELKRRADGESKMRCDLQVSLLGASFGGALALLLSQNETVKRTLLISPLLDLQHQRERGGSDFRLWFDSNFSNEDFRDISLESFTRSVNMSSRTCLIHGGTDEVLGQTMFEKFSAALRSQHGHSVYQHEGPHVPVAYRDVMSQLTHATHFLTESTDTVC